MALGAGRVPRMSGANTPYLPTLRPGSRPRARLFCFPWAGGGASAFRGWLEETPASLQVLPVQLPGREGRLIDAPFTHLPPLVDALEEAVAPHVDRPFAVFGHSVGALIGFELMRRLRERHGKSAVGLFVAGCGAPQTPEPGPAIHSLPQPEFIEELRRLQGIPEEVLACRELLELVIPTIRADYALHETYDYADGPPLACPILAFRGTSDTTVEEAREEAWREQTTGRFELRRFPGGHFFLRDHRSEIIAGIIEGLERELES